MQLVGIAGWNQIPADWSRMLRVAPHGCFLAEWDGRPAGTAVATVYGTDCAWIGMVLVHPDFRRRGIGGHLIEYCLGYLKSLGVRTIKLDATDEGRAVYLKHGFVDEYGTRRHVGPLNARSRRYDRYQVVPISKGHLPALVEMDRRAFGADRSVLLSVLSETNPKLALGVVEGSRLEAYGFARPGRQHGYVGPVASANMEAAEALVAALGQRVGTKQIMLDVTAQNPAWCAWVESAGLLQRRRLTRMYWGTNDSPGETSLVYALSGFETG